MNHLLLPAGATLLAASLSAQVVLTPITTLDVSNAVTGIGNNPVAVAWNGTDLFVAGFNGSTVTANVAIVKISNATTTPAIGTPFGTSSTVSNRGYSGLDIDMVNGRLSAAYDSGAVVTNGIACYDLNGNLLWQKNARGSCGGGFDPGSLGGNPALGTGVGWTNFGSAGRALQEAGLGTDIYSTASGMGIAVSGENLNYRDFAFDPRNGDIYVRAANNIFKGVRTGDNSCVTSLFLDAIDAPLSNQQNIAFVRTSTGTVLLYNDRQGNVVGQLHTDVLKAVRTDGSMDVIDFTTWAPGPGAGAYDFSYDPATETIAISDYLAHAVTIFSIYVSPTFAYGAGCAGLGAFVPRLSATSTFQSSAGTVAYNLDQAAPTSIALVALGFGRMQVPLGNGCDILITPILNTFLGPVFTGIGSGPGTGTGSMTINVPGGFRGLSLTAQSVVMENGDPNQIRLSNGVQLIVP